MPFVTTNIRFDRESYKRLKFLAVEEQKSLAQLIREAVEKVYGVPKRSTSQKNWHKDLFFHTIGICATGITDGAVRHDRDIYGVKS